MSSLPSVTGAIHLVFGFFVFWTLQGWAVSSETLSPDTPSPRQPGRLPFVVGQGIALLAQSSLALLCAHALNPILNANNLIFLPLGCAGILYLLESIWIAANHTLPAERRPIELLTFTSGRDLMLRHASTIFLAQGLLATVQGTRSAALQASGGVLGWGFSILLWETRVGLSFLRIAKWILSPLALWFGLVLLFIAWRNFF